MNTDIIIDLVASANRPAYLPTKPHKRDDEAITIINTLNMARGAEERCCRNDGYSLQAQLHPELTGWQHLEQTIQDIVTSQLNSQVRSKNLVLNPPSTTFSCVVDEMTRDIEGIRMAPMVNFRGRSRAATNRMSLSSVNDCVIRRDGRCRRYTIATDSVDPRSDCEFAASGNKFDSDTESKFSNGHASDDDCFELLQAYSSRANEHKCETTSKTNWTRTGVPLLRLESRRSPVENIINLHAMQQTYDEDRSLQRKESSHNNSVLSSKLDCTQPHLDENAKHRNVLYERYLNSPHSWADGLTRYGQERLAELQRRKVMRGQNRVRLHTAPQRLRKVGSAMPTSSRKRAKSAISSASEVISDTVKNASDNSSQCSYDQSFFD